MIKGLFKDWETKDVMAVGAVSRAQTGFSFVRRCLDEYPHGTLRAEAVSPPYSRQINILIAYNFELILNSLMFIGLLNNTENDLISEVKVGHRLDVLWNKIKSTDTRNLFGIKNIQLKNKDVFKFYEINFEDKKLVTIHNLNNIRYDINDFRDEETTKLRPSVSDEENIVNAVEISRKLSKDIMEYIYKKYPDNLSKT
ncbi:MAG: hypothetical protein HYT03_01605 [Candidatus Harrisonbacteria bacterium]|nr:hypothetical protein [Candidatus Harrisonbacteria bacterium]